MNSKVDNRRHQLPNRDDSAKPKSSREGLELGHENKTGFIEHENGRMMNPQCSRPHHDSAQDSYHVRELETRKHSAEFSVPTEPRRGESQ